jgi:hypothetical protein
LVFNPRIVPWTVTLITQDCAAARASLVRVTPAELMLAPHVFVVVPVICSPDVRVSVKPTPLSEALAFTLGFMTVIVMLVVPLSGIPATPNAFEITGGRTTRMSVETAAPVPPFEETGLTGFESLPPGGTP